MYLGKQDQVQGLEYLSGHVLGVVSGLHRNDNVVHVVEVEVWLDVASYIGLFFGSEDMVLE